MSWLEQGRGGVLQGHDYKGAANQKLRNQTCVTFYQAVCFCFFLFFIFSLFFILVAAKMTTAVVSPFFDFEVMNKVFFEALFFPSRAVFVAVLAPLAC